MKFVVGTALAALMALTVPGTAPAFAGDSTKDGLKIEGAWSRATPPKAPTGAAFMTITNGGADDDVLLGASAEVSKVAELHLHLDLDGTMQMREVESIEIRPGQTITFEPGGLHVMLIGLKQPLAQGQSFPLTLNFEKAGPVVVPVDVQALGAMGGGMMGGGMMMQHDPAMHEEHMKDPAHREMHEKMHGPGK